MILEDVTFDVGVGQHWAMIGPNGAGKTTIMNLLAATTFPTTGTVHVLGDQLGRVDLRDLRRRIGHVTPRHPLSSNLSALDVALTGETATVELLGPGAYSDEIRHRAEMLCKEFGLDDPAAARWLTMSQGERGKALIARALVTDPPLVLLDEPSTGLDLATREQMVRTIGEMQETRPELTTVTVTHHLEELPATTSHAVLVKAGRVMAAGPVEEVLTSASVSECYAYPLTLERRRGRWSAFAA